MRNIRFIALAALVAAMALPSLAPASQPAPHGMLTQGPVVYGTGQAAAAAGIAASSSVPTATSAAVRATGTSSQGEDVSMLVSARTLAITNFSIDWNARCASGDSLSGGSGVKRVKLSRKLKFTGKGSYGAQLEDGLTATVNVTLAGRVNRRSVSGTFSARTIVADGAGQVIDTCDTGLVRWTAR